MRVVRRALALGLVLAALPAAAAVFRSITVEEGARTSDAVVRGRVEQRTSRFSKDRSTIVTDVVVSVASAWKGDPGARVTVTVPGGEVGDQGIWVDGAPTFAAGEEVVVFLARRGAGWNVNGLALGKYRVEGERVHPELGNARVVASPVRAGEALVAEMSVAELEARVRAAK
jgi:hypothetical protein